MQPVYLSVDFIEQSLEEIREKFRTRTFTDYHAGWKQYNSLRNFIQRNNLQIKLPTRQQLWEETQ